MVLHVQARVDILRYTTEKILIFGNLAWVKATQKIPLHEIILTEKIYKKVITVMGRRPV